MNLKKILVRKGTEIINKKCTPSVLVGLTVTGIVVTGVMSYRAGLKAKDILKEKKKKKEELKKKPESTKEEKIDLVKETVKEMCPIVAPPVIIGGVAIACALSGQKMNAKRIAVLSAAYSVTKDALESQEGKIVEMLGGGQAKKIKDGVAKDKIKKVKTSDVKAQKTGHGTQLCKDLKFGTLFYSSINAVQGAINNISADCIDERWVTLDDFYDKLNVEHIGVGSDMGWCSGDLCKGRLPITVTPILNEDQEIVLCLDYDIGVSETFPIFDRY